ncbi:MAG: SigB/SigF/SigG family RNA polymerase sigma factor, partial [Clostridia bacterium]|nr:SigB/SigF/SigG family RNA polymerase sigma factor [Clostridia bacterium]
MSIRDLSEEKISNNSNKELFELYQQNHDIDIRNELIQRNLYIIDVLVKKYINKGIEYDDLYQVASLGLIKAVERFDISKGFKFGSFATPTILKKKKKYFRDKGWTIRVPRKTQEISVKLQKAKEKLTQELQRIPMVSEIAEYLECTEEDILQAMEAASAYDIHSIHQTFENNNQDKDLMLEEILGKEDKHFSSFENQDFILKIMETFSDVEKEIFELRFLKEEKQSEIAKKLEVSQMTISRMERKIIEKFKNEL